MTQQFFNPIVEGSPSTILQISAADLRAVVNEMWDRAQENAEKTLAEHRERPTMTREEAAKALNVTLSTLWRWDKINYLKPVKIGTKVLYRASDIERMLTSKQGKEAI